ARVSRRLDLHAPPPQMLIELALQPLLSALFSHESEHVTGEVALGIKALRFLGQFDSVDGQPANALGRSFVDAPLDPDEPPVGLRELLQDPRTIEAQRARDPCRGHLARAWRFERRRSGKYRVDLLGHRQRFP